MQNRPINARLYARLHLDHTFPIDVGLSLVRDIVITRLHQHECFEIGFCHSGAGVFLVQDRVLPFRAGDVSVISEVDPHLGQSVAGTVSEWSFANLDPLGLVPAAVEERWLLRTECFTGPDFPNIFTAERHPQIVATVRAIVEEMSVQATGYRSAVRAQTWNLMVALHREFGGAETTHVPATASHFEPIAPALEAIARDYTRSIRVEELADCCLCSVTHFRRLFTRAMGQSPLEYLTRFRISMAMTLLAHTDQSVAEVAGAVGYSSLSSFNRHFLEATGISPRQWRRGVLSP